MSISLDIVPTVPRLLTPAELANEWSAGFPDAELTIRRIRPGGLDRLPTEVPLALGGYYALEWSDGVDSGLSIYSNVAMGCDEEGEIAEFGDPSHHAHLIATWRAIGHTYTLTLSGGYGAPSIRRMEQVAGVISHLVKGYVLVLDSWYSRPRGLYAPDTFP
ncbi:MAG: hypothetical protein R3F65_23420 [bacterium]